VARFIAYYGRMVGMKIPWLVVGLLGGILIAVIIAPLMNTSHVRFWSTWEPLVCAGVGLIIGIVIDLLRPGW